MTTEMTAELAQMQKRMPRVLAANGTVALLVLVAVFSMPWISMEYLGLAQRGFVFLGGIFALQMAAIGVAKALTWPVIPGVGVFVLMATSGYWLLG